MWGVSHPFTASGVITCRCHLATWCCREQVCGQGLLMWSTVCIMVCAYTYVRTYVRMYMYTSHVHTYVRIYVCTWDSICCTLSEYHMLSCTSHAHHMHITCCSVLLCLGSQNTPKPHQPMELDESKPKRPKIEGV